MAARAMWKGTLQFSLVSIPMKMYAASESGAKISFHQYHKGTTDKDGKFKACGAQIHMHKHCDVCNVDLSGGDIERGFEFAKGQHVVVTDEELDSIAETASHVLHIDTITDEAIDPLYLDGTSYLVPETGPALLSFNTMRDALEDRYAIGTIVLRDKAVRVALEARKQGFIVYRLRAANQVRTFDTIAEPASDVVPSAADVKLAKQLIANYTGSFSYDSVKDEYQESLQILLDAKVNGTEVAVAPAKKVQAVASLSEALAASLAAAQEKPKAKAKLPAKTNVVAKATMLDKKKKKTA